MKEETYRFQSFGSGTSAARRRTQGPQESTKKYSPQKGTKITKNFLAYGLDSTSCTRTVLDTTTRSAEAPRAHHPYRRAARLDNRKGESSAYPKIFVFL